MVGDNLKKSKSFPTDWIAQEGAEPRRSRGGREYRGTSRKARALQRLLTVWLWLSSLLFPARHDVEMLMQPPPPPCCGRGCSGFFNKT